MPITKEEFENEMFDHYVKHDLRHSDVIEILDLLVNIGIKLRYIRLTPTLKILDNMLSKSIQYLGHSYFHECSE